MGSSLCPRILEAWAQSAARARDQRAAITQFQQAGSRRLLWTHWAQWQAALLSMRLEPQGKAWEAQVVDLRQWPRVASRGRLLAQTPAPALWKKVSRPRWGGSVASESAYFSPWWQAWLDAYPGDPLVGTRPLPRSRTTSRLWKPAIFGSISKHLLSTY